MVEQTVALVDTDLKPVVVVAVAVVVDPLQVEVRSDTVYQFCVLILAVR